MKFFALSLAMAFGLTVMLSMPVSIPTAQGDSVSITAEAHAKKAKSEKVKKTKKKSHKVSQQKAAN